MLIRSAAVAVATVGLVAAGSGAAYAHECVNISKNMDAGLKVVIDAASGEVVWASPAIENAIRTGRIDPETGEGFTGLLGLDFDGDGAADAVTYIVTPSGEIPLNAQTRGAECRGIVNFEAVFTCPTAPL